MINNSQTILELRKATHIYNLSEKLPNLLADKIVPVIEVNPRLLRTINVVKQSTKTTTGTTAIYTTPTNKDFFLTNYALSVSSDASSDCIVYILQFTTIDGVVNSIRICKQTLTAHAATMADSFDVPMQLARGSAINVSLAFTVGASTIAATVMGYEIDNSNA